MSELVILDDGAQTRVGPFCLTLSGLAVDGEPTYAEWAACGAWLRRVGACVQWAIGDWLNYGERRWGERYTEAVEATGYDYQTLRNMKAVAGGIELSRRRDNLPFTAHAEVAGLSPEKADAVLDRAESEGLSTRQVRMLARQERATPVTDPGPVAGDDGARVVKDLAVLSGEKFGTVYADPPWSYANQGTRAATGNHYGTMTVEEIAALPVQELAADAAHLWLWTTNAFLFECPRLFRAWGFEFKSSYVWVKPQMGIGNYLRNSHELLLLGTRGGLTGAARDVRSWGEFSRTEHSAKPEWIRANVVERVSPGPRLELFGRRPAAGWTVWGDQIARSSLFDPEAELVT